MTLFDDLNSQLWVLGAIGRLADQGLLLRPADADDEVSRLSQQLLIDTGWLAADPIRPTAQLLSAAPPGVPLGAVSGYVREQLGRISRFADGAPPGWAETDRELIRWRGRSSGAIVQRIFGRVCPDVLPRATSFLDVGTGAGGIAMQLCRQLPDLHAVGIDVSPTALDVARRDVAEAGLDDRIELRDQSVDALSDVDAYDLVWLPQQFIPRPVLEAALPLLCKATRADGCFVMALSTEHDLANLMSGGGTMSVEDAVKLVTHAGFLDVQDHDHVITGRR
ncbi:cyclopropane-fatty-acyl-phospholipid synthase family protein [Kutzneria buriramensis]|nr:class I SAM-dependent methyltransferase [Kutzneria buriramensis]